jgi:hypothetical protein
VLPRRLLLDLYVSLRGAHAVLRKTFSAACIPCSGVCEYDSFYAVSNELLRSFSYLWFLVRFFPTEVRKTSLPSKSSLPHPLLKVLLTRLESPEHYNCTVCLLGRQTAKRRPLAPPEMSVGPSVRHGARKQGRPGPVAYRLSIPMILHTGNVFIGL